MHYEIRAMSDVKSGQNQSGLLIQEPPLNLMPVERSKSTKSVRSLPRLAMSPSLRRRMTGGKRSRCSLPDAACLVGLTSQLDEAMEDMKMMMGTIGSERPGLELNSDTDTDDEDDTEDEDDEDDMSGTAADRLACQYEASIKEVLGLLLDNPGNKVGALEELREELWLLRQAAQLNMEAAEGNIQFDFEYAACKTDFDQK